jgi:hypothetical protein
MTIGQETAAESIDEADVDKNKAVVITPDEVPTGREMIRADLARGLLWLLTGTIGAVIFFVGIGQIQGSVLTESIFPSLVTLTGTALGFYFGSQTAKEK